MKRIALGCDHNAFRLKELIKVHLKSMGRDVEDYGVHSEDPVDYPDIAERVAEAIAEGIRGYASKESNTGRKSR